MTDQDIARRQRIPGIWLPGWSVDLFRHCTHSEIRRIYGDEILAAAGRRNRCLICGRLW